MARKHFRLLRAAGELPREDQVAAATLGTAQQPHGTVINTTSRQFPPLATCVFGAAPRRS